MKNSHILFYKMFAPQKGLPELPEEKWAAPISAAQAENLLF